MKDIHSLLLLVETVFMLRFYSEPESRWAMRHCTELSTLREAGLNEEGLGGHSWGWRAISHLCPATVGKGQSLGNLVGTTRCEVLRYSTLLSAAGDSSSHNPMFHLLTPLSHSLPSINWGTKLPRIEIPPLISCVTLDKSLNLCLGFFICKVGLVIALTS